MACRLFRLGLLAACAQLVAAADLVPGRAFDRFISIWLENQDFDKVTADSAFAELRKQGILQTRYYAQTHPSQPNYLAAIAGDYWGLDHDDVVRIPKNVSTIVDLLNDKRISWSAAMESIPSPGYLGNASLAEDGYTVDYVRKHNPFASYDSIANHGFKLINVRSLDDFKRSLAEGTVPQFVMMSPNMLHDGHDTTLENATIWSRDFLQPLLKDNSKIFAERTLIQLTYDETEDYSQPNRIVSLLLGNAVPADLRGTEDNDFYTHFSILSTVQNNWELSNLGRYDVGANVFRVVAEKTGYKNMDPPNAERVNNSVSYPGFLNMNHTTKLTTLPAPNLNLVGAGGKGILQSIKETWGNGAGAGGQIKTPYDGKHYVFDGDNVPEYTLQ
ncbi:phosphoesterase family-domain-containing protein [Microdochium trichocladiopsis]|uniref:Phosphoesterase family-domain-containing protein n=1 Tax=Microdochium trichocladiopsis TaxID=1682393 RepID=A0A9P8XVI2_9PEZI|nr:phosphoesterase family-domain-containing protein [Microdochium trichocladiopsis]KAH7021286.1 phosphoesterase family-domain-containing protein [Microdochium trichocladiopsis]